MTKSCFRVLTQTGGLSWGHMSTPGTKNFSRNMFNLFTAREEWCEILLFNQKLMNSHTHYCLCVFSKSSLGFFLCVCVCRIYSKGSSREKIHFIFNYEIMTPLLFYYFMLHYRFTVKGRHDCDCFIVVYPDFKRNNSIADVFDTWNPSFLHVQISWTGIFICWSFTSHVCPMWLCLLVAVKLV